MPSVIDDIDKIIQRGAKFTVEVDTFRNAVASVFADHPNDLGGKSISELVGYDDLDYLLFDSWEAFGFSGGVMGDESLRIFRWLQFNVSVDYADKVFFTKFDSVQDISFRLSSAVFSEPDSKKKYWRRDVRHDILRLRYECNKFLNYLIALQSMIKASVTSNKQLDSPVDEYGFGADMAGKHLAEEGGSSRLTIAAGARYYVCHNQGCSPKSDNRKFIKDKMKDGTLSDPLTHDSLESYIKSRGLWRDAPPTEPVARSSEDTSPTQIPTCEKCGKRRSKLVLVNGFNTCGDCLAPT